MVDSINLPLILVAAFITTASPGPATLAIAGTSMARGRPFGLALAAGITSGSLIWSAAAALGLSAIMLTNAWVFELIRYVGATYLLFLAWKSARAAFARSEAVARGVKAQSLHAAYLKGLALHLTNPKAILFFGSLYSLGVPHGTSLSALSLVIVAVGVQSFILFHAFALMFSLPRLVARYSRLRRWFEATFAVAFAAAGVKILTARLT